ncbi:MRG [Trema orientale]|uniref:MRG n=1 Tax=Trema orientale TaxID=63057 RepID=A0A2P5EGQ0_TREOI|nr:MRG [Trema orientale]
MPYTEENVQKHLAVNKKREMDKTMKLARSSNLKEKMVVRGKKRKNDDHLFMDNIHVPMRKYAKIKIPPRLKKHLVDCEVFTRMGKLVRLPRSPNVNDIFDRYLRYRKKEDESLADSLQEVMKGLQSYFDKALPVMLLYRIERRQYEEAIADDITPSDVYGAEHLLRLFVKLPELLYYAEIEEETFAELMKKVNDFLKWLRTNQRAFFRWDYYAAKEIQRRANKRDD